MADSNVPVNTAAAGGPLVKTIRAVDVNGNVVQIQAIVLTDEDGRVLSASTAALDAILAEMQVMRRAMVLLAMQMTGQAVPEAD